jgi:hypothetical protein
MQKGRSKCIFLLGAVLSISCRAVPTDGQAPESLNFQTQLLAAEPSNYLNFNDHTASFKDQVAGAVFVPSSTGTVLPQQPGFDSTAPANKSASFTYDAYLTATNDATGDFEWDKPFSVLIHVNHLNYSNSGTMYFVSKGDVGAIQQPSFVLSMSMNAGQPQLCFTLNGVGGNASNTIARPFVCTHPGIRTFANGYNYDLIATNDGSGSPSALQLYVNGFTPPYPVYLNNALYRFGSVVVTVGTSGTGYADKTQFLSVGGGQNCNVSGTLQAQNGVPKSVIYSTNWGCDSLPTINLSAATGSGATLSTVLFGAHMSTLNRAPLVIGGALVSGKHLGIGGTAATTPPQFIDEFAVFPRVLTAYEIQRLFYQTKFYQGLLKTQPIVAPLVVFDNDGCGDSDNIYALALVIAADKLGYIKLAGAVDTDGSGPSMAMYRQILDNAGMNGVPVGVPSSTSIRSNLCTASEVDAVNPYTPQSSSGYIRAATLYRHVLADNPNKPLYIVLGGSFRGVSDLMQSDADNISPMTGAEMIARDAINGGAIFAQGLGCCGTFTGDNSLQDWSAGQYVVEHNRKLPIYWFGGIPQSSGPGILWTRDNPDPVYVFAKGLGTDTRQAYDSLAVAPLLSNIFSGGVTVAIGGTGTGYANATPFTSSGGGPACFVTGSMISVDGVPSSVKYDAGVYAGVGWGCDSTPTIILGTSGGSGALLTATPTMTCGTVSISGSHNGSTSDAVCSNHYFLPLSSLAAPGSVPILTWFLNSLIDDNPLNITDSSPPAEPPLRLRSGPIRPPRDLPPLLSRY